MLKKTYFKRALECNPDKGGSKEQFQALQNAYDSLNEASKQSAPCPAPRDGSANGAAYDHHYDHMDDSQYYEDQEEGSSQGFWQGWWSDFFGGFAVNDAFFDTNDAYEEFSHAYDKTAKERAQERQANIRERFDWRDSKAPAVQVLVYVCVECVRARYACANELTCMFDSRHLRPVSKIQLHTLPTQVKKRKVTSQHR